MSDDLSAFFAKKKDKKKKTAVKIEEVGQVLERRAKRQEEYEQEHEEPIEKRTDDDKGGLSNAEESEWIEYGDSNQGRLEGLKIKDMGLENEDDQVNNEEPEDRGEAHETKTWGQISDQKKNAAAEESENAVTISDKAMAAAYKPPAFRKGASLGGYRRAMPANFDMSSDAAFPSLADASKIEKVKKEEGKSAGGWVKAGSGSGPSGPPKSYTMSSGSGRESALAAAKQNIPPPNFSRPPSNFSRPPFNSIVQHFPPKKPSLTHYFNPISRKDLPACSNGVPCPVNPGNQELDVTIDFSKYEQVISLLKDNQPYQVEYLLHDNKSGDNVCLMIQAWAYIK
uniref:Uncharacterized protein n=1 Tax=Caenorhabditis japonica TaxID=281687 RepID=A0A8R1HYZ3_CAEJA